MRESKHSSNSLVEAPYNLRPGTSCNIKRTCSFKNIFTWDSSVVFTYTLDGYFNKEAVKSDISIPASAITITESAGYYTVNIAAIDKGIIGLTISHYEVIEETVTAISAFNTTRQNYYLDYIIENSTIYPMSILELSVLPSTVFDVVNTTVEIDSDNNGIAYMKNDSITLSSQGCLMYKEEWVNIIRVGKKLVSVPGDFTGPFIKQEGDKKVIECDIQEWLPGYSETRGIALYYHNIFITTDKGLCVFNWYKDFSTPELIDETIIGYDITNYPDDSIGVATNGQIHIFRLKHDNIYIDGESKRIYFREKDPCFALSETL